MEKDTQQMNDHDLIVSMHTTMTRAVDDIKKLDDKVTDMNNNYAKKVDVDKDFNNVQADIKWLQRIAYGGLGILAAIQFYFNFIK